MGVTSTDRAMTVQEAYDAVDAFGRHAGRVPLLLLLHASVPQSFRADLLNLLKSNFLSQEAGQDLTIDADVLLSPLVQPAAAGYYRLDPEVRRHGLALLDAEYRHQAERRSVQVARLLLAYADAVERDAGQALDALLAEYLAVQRWVALAFIDPSGAAEAFARAIDQGIGQHAAAVSMRLGSVTAAVSIPLTGHRELLAYARGLDAIATGDTATGQRLLDWIGEDELRVGDVTLRTRAMPQPREVETPRVAPAPNPAQQASNDLVFISYSRPDRETADAIARSLVAEGLEVWIDHERISLSGDRHEQIQAAIEAIDRCALFLPLISRHSVTVEGRLPPRREWDYAMERSARRQTPPSFTICPVGIDDTSPGSWGVPAQLRALSWLTLEGAETGAFVQAVKARLAERRARPPARMFGVLAPPVAMLGRSRELSQLEAALTFEQSPQQPGPKRIAAATVALVGPAGIGKWTLANHAVHGVANHFPDGVIWLGDDGLAPLVGYAHAFDIAGLFDEEGITNAGRIQAAFAARRVLFVGDERGIGHFFPTLSLAGARCVVLSLMSDTPTGTGQIVQLSPLADRDAAQLLYTRADRAVDRQALDFAAGNPLLLRLVGGAIAIGSESEVLAYLRRNKRPGGTSPVDPRVAWMVEYLWQSQEEAMAALIAATGDRTQVAISRLPRGRPADLERAGLVNIHADVVRVHPDVAAAVRDLMRARSRPAAQQARQEDSADESPASRPAAGAIYISYASEDREIANAMASALAAAGLDVWLDRDRLMGGDDFETNIMDSIRRCALFLPILSRQSAAREGRYFRLEWILALKRAELLPHTTRFIFPVVIDDLPISDPAIPEGLRQLHWFSLRDGVTPAFVEAVRQFYREHAVVRPTPEASRAMSDGPDHAPTRIPSLEAAADMIARGELEKAYAFLEERLRLCEQDGNREEAALTLGEMAALALRGRDLDRAMDMQRRRLALHDELGDQRGRAAALVAIGDIDYRSERFDDALANMQRAVEIYERLGDRLEGARLQGFMGRLLDDLGRPEEGIAALEQALASFGASAEDSGRIGLAQTYGTLAEISFEREDYRRAVEFARERLIVASTLLDPTERLEALASAAEITARSGDVGQGEQLFGEARRLAAETGRIETEIDILANMGRLRAATGDVEAALRLFEEAWAKASDRVRTIEPVTALAESYGRLLLAVGRRPLATTVLEDARRSFEQMRRTRSQRRVEQLLTSPDTEETRQALVNEMRQWIHAPPPRA